MNPNSRTPGPWRVEWYPYPHIRTTEDDRCVFARDCGSDADLALIVAAPDLYEIVRRFVLTYECVAIVTGGEPTHLMQSAKAALAKADNTEAIENAARCQGGA